MKLSDIYPIIHYRDHEYLKGKRPYDEYRTPPKLWFYLIKTAYIDGLLTAHEVIDFCMLIKAHDYNTEPFNQFIQEIYEDYLEERGY